MTGKNTVVSLRFFVLAIHADNCAHAVRWGGALTLGQSTDWHQREICGLVNRRLLVIETSLAPLRAEVCFGHAA